MLQADAQDLGGQLLGAPLLALHVGVVEHQRVEVAVAGVEDVGDPQSALARHLGDAAQHLGQRRAGDDPVLDVVVRADPPDRGKGGLASLPEQRPLLVGLGDADLGRAHLAADPLHLAELVLALGPRAVQLDDQHRARLGVVGVDRGLGRLDRQGVHHLDGGGHDAGADHPGDRLARLVGRAEGGEQRADRLGLAQDAHGDPGGDAERALGAHEGADQVVTGRVGRLSAEMDQLAVGQHHLQPGDVVGGEAVLQAVGAAGVLRHVAADRADLLAGGVRRVVVAVRRDRLGHIQVDHAGLDHHALVGDVQLEDPPHAREHDQHAVGHRQRPAREPRARATGNERHLEVVADLDGALHLLRGLGQDDQAGDHPEGRQAVALVGPELIAFRDDPPRSDHGRHPPDELRPVHHGLLPAHSR